MNAYLDVAVEAAREGGAILLAEFDRPRQITYKGDADIVTQADKGSERAIVTRLRDHFPKHSIVAEEGGGQENASAFRWYVDPLDGTTNYAHSYPCFAVSIGLEEAGELLVAVVYNPISQEMFTAVRGEGAFLNQKRIHVSNVDTLATSLVATGFPTHKRESNPNIRYYWDFTLRSHGVRRDGSAALDLASVACGRFEGFWEFGLKSWDTAAGALLVREAGGSVTRFVGAAPYRPGEPDMVASNTRVHAEMQKLLAEIGSSKSEPTK
jgi:myo-inositol-1(or 4)-monophosphatase